MGFLFIWKAGEPNRKRTPPVAEERPKGASANGRGLRAANGCGGTPLASTSGKLPHPISQLAFAGCDIFVPASKDPYRKTVLNKTPENKGFSGAFFFRYTQKYTVHFLIAFENTSSTAFATNFNLPFTSDPWMS